LKTVKIVKLGEIIPASEIETVHHEEFRQEVEYLDAAGF